MKIKPAKTYNLLVYVLDSTNKIKRFDSTEKMGKFIDSFLKKYPDYMSNDSGNWIDYAITDVGGEVHFFTDGLEVE